MGIVLLISMVVLYLAMRTYYNREDAFFISIAVWNFYLFLMIEFLSLFKAVGRFSLLVGWLIMLIICITVLVKSQKSVFDNIKSIKIPIIKSEPVSILIVFVAGLSVLTFFIAILSPPSNWDSLTYHLSRVMNWMQNKSVDYYTTNIRRSLFSPPMAEYVVLNIYELFGNDLFVNMVQWFSYVFCNIGIYYICRRININKICSCLCVFLSAALPMAIAQSCTTQVDLFGSLWLVVFLWFIIDITEQECLNIKNRKNTVSVAMCAIAVGLGYVSKSTVSVIMVVFLIYMLIVLLRKKTPIINLVPFLVIAALIVAVAAVPSFVRNYRYTGDILASDYMGGILVGSINPILLFLNMCKNCGMLGARPAFRHFIGSTLEKVAYKLGYDINAPEISHTYDYTGNLSVSMDMDYAPNSVVMWTFAISLIILLIILIRMAVKKRDKINGRPGFIVSCCIGALTLCCAVRYQMWGNRLLLPALYLMCIVIAYVINEMKVSYNVKYYWCVAIVLFAFLDVYNCMAVQVQPAKDYFRYGNRRNVHFRVRGNQEPYDYIRDIVNSEDYNVIGLKIAEDTFEYPLWLDLKKEDNKLIHLVDNTDNAMDVPDCIVVIDQDVELVTGDKLDYSGKEYECIWHYEGGGQYAVLSLQTGR